MKGADLPNKEATGEVACILVEIITSCTCDVIYVSADG
jgi:hypothetical protein